MKPKSYSHVKGSRSIVIKTGNKPHYFIAELTCDFGLDIKSLRSTADDFLVSTDTFAVGLGLLLLAFIGVAAITTFFLTPIAGGALIGSSGGEGAFNGSTVGGAGGEGAFNGSAGSGSAIDGVFMTESSPSDSRMSWAEGVADEFWEWRRKARAMSSCASAVYGSKKKNS